MSVRVVARIRPLLKAELEKDIIVNAGSTSLDTSAPSTVTIPDPKHQSQNFTFNFNRVFERESSQQELFDGEVSPTVKHLFTGYDVTIFAYGVTGTGKTHTMRGGKSLADRGVIPRLLSSIYRKQRKMEKDSDGEKTVDVSLSYYEIYNDKVFDLFEPPEKRILAGLPIRDNNGKTVISGLTERPCTTLKEFEQLYDEANINRSTSATKLNAHSSRSHAILQVKVTQTSNERTIVSTVSAIDLAGSEDNRRTDNNKERLVESSSINKSLFVLAQCVEAISKKQSRIPYRESKMTRILSLGQNNGLTIMILNLAPVRSYHLDTLSSLNFANRTKKIEIREIENEPFYTGKLPSKGTPAIGGSALHRQPLKPIPSATNTALKSVAPSMDKPTKSFSVFAEKGDSKRPSDPRSLKRSSDSSQHMSGRPTKIMRPSGLQTASKLKEPEMSRASIEELVNKMVDEKLAKQALDDADKSSGPVLSDEIQRRLDALEQRVEKKEDGDRAEGLQYLLMAKQHTVRGEDSSALSMYKLAMPFFPDNDKLAHKMMVLQDRLEQKREEVVKPKEALPPRPNLTSVKLKAPSKPSRVSDAEYTDELQHEEDDDDFDANFQFKKNRKPTKPKYKKILPSEASESWDRIGDLTPRSSKILSIINTRDEQEIRMLRGVGARRAELIVNELCEMKENDDVEALTSMEQVGGLKGVGIKTLENMKWGMEVIP